MSDSPPDTDRLDQALSQLALLEAFDAARRVDYAPYSHEVTALKRAEALWQKIKHTS